MSWPPPPLQSPIPLKTRGKIKSYFEQVEEAQENYRRARVPLPLPEPEPPPYYIFAIVINASPNLRITSTNFRPVVEEEDNFRKEKSMLTWLLEQFPTPSPSIKSYNLTQEAQRAVDALSLTPAQLRK